MPQVCLALTFAKTSGETSSSVVQSFPFLFPTDWRDITDIPLHFLYIKKMCYICKFKFHISTHPVVHEQILYNEVCHNGLHWWCKLVWGQHGDVAQRHEGSDELLWDVCIQTTGQRLRGEVDNLWVRPQTEVKFKYKKKERGVQRKLNQEKTFWSYKW